jgi:hypothetical protein
MLETYYLDENGEPQRTDNPVLLEAMIRDSRRVVARDTVDPFVISTVFLIYDHNWDRYGRPVLWETMVFGPRDDELECERYTSREEALAGHARLVARYRDMVEGVK